MSRRKILHICALDSVNAIIPPYIAFVRQHFGTVGEHRFLTWGRADPLPYEEGPDTLHLPSLGSERVRLFKEINLARRIIIHGLFSKEVIEALFFQPWLLKKCYWMIWGGDLYKYLPSGYRIGRSVSGHMRTHVVKRMGHFVSFIKGDYELAVKHYGAKGAFVECFMYPSNICKVSQKTSSGFVDAPRTVLVGNSATRSNNHLEIFERLDALEDQRFEVICPLSYGERGYANTVLSAGKRLFGDRFRPLLEFMPLQAYLDLLEKIDIAVFAHKRQQSMGNTITLLGLGKKVYMQQDVTPVRFFEQLGVAVFDVKKIDLEPLAEHAAKHNSEAIREYFSERNLVKQTSRLFDD